MKISHKYNARRKESKLLITNYKKIKKNKYHI